MEISAFIRGVGSGWQTAPAEPAGLRSGWVGLSQYHRFRAASAATASGEAAAATAAAWEEAASAIRHHQKRVECR